MFLLYISVIIIIAEHFFQMPFVYLLWWSNSPPTCIEPREMSVYTQFKACTVSSLYLNSLSKTRNDSLFISKRIDNLLCRYSWIKYNNKKAWIDFFMATMLNKRRHHKTLISFMLHSRQHVFILREVRKVTTG